MIEEKKEQNISFPFLGTLGIQVTRICEVISEGKEDNDL